MARPLAQRPHCLCSALRHRGQVQGGPCSCFCPSSASPCRPAGAPLLPPGSGTHIRSPCLPFSPPPQGKLETLLPCGPSFSGLWPRPAPYLLVPQPRPHSLLPGSFLGPSSPSTWDLRPSKPRPQPPVLPLCGTRPLPDGSSTSLQGSAGNPRVCTCPWPHRAVTVACPWQQLLDLVALASLRWANRRCPWLQAGPADVQPGFPVQVPSWLEDNGAVLVTPPTGPTAHA